MALIALIILPGLPIPSRHTFVNAVQSLGTDKINTTVKVTDYYLELPPLLTKLGTESHAGCNLVGYI